MKKKEVLGNIAYEQLKEKILRNEYEPGEKIMEQELEQALGVSRTPIREALRRLAADGLVNIYPNRYSEVATFDQQTIYDIGCIRLAHECVAVQQALQNGSNRDFETLRDIAFQCEEASAVQDLYNRIKLDADFHMRIAEISGNKTLYELEERIFLRIRLLQITLLKKTASACKLQEHLQIVDALIERNTKKVLDLTCVHLGTFYGMNPSEYYQPVLK